MSGEIREAIDSIFKNNKNKDEIYSLVCTVNSVNGSERTCTVTPVNGGAELQDTRIQASLSLTTGIFISPTVDSKVIVSFLTNATAYISLYSEIDSIEIDTTLVKFNGGSNGGMIKIIDLTAKLNQMVGEVQAQLGLIATGIIAAGGTYSPGALSTFVENDYENQDVIH